MTAKHLPRQLLGSLLLGLSVAACDGTTVTDPELSKITPAQIAGTYALQTHNGESLPLVLSSTYSGEFDDGEGPWLLTPMTINSKGLLTLRSFYTVFFLGPKDPPGTYTALPGQQPAPGIASISGSVVINADGTCAVTLWKNTSMGNCRLTHHLVELTRASLVLKKEGSWTATSTHQSVPGSAATYTDTGRFSIEGSRIVVTPAFPPSSPDCTTTAALAGEVLTAVARCQGTSPSQETLVWKR